MMEAHLKIAQFYLPLTLFCVYKVFVLIRFAAWFIIRSFYHDAMFIKSFNHFI